MRKGPGVSKRGHVPVRMCMGCHQRKQKEMLIRLVKSSDGTFSLDETREAYGRGYYLCPDRSCLKMARKKLKGLGTMGLMDHGRPSIEGGPLG
jgi:predicted RNA-binding protein YlxR (DUF448 family)